MSMWTFALLPSLRDEVVLRVGQQSDYIYIDELSAAFIKSNANWHNRPDGAGFNGHSYDTLSTIDPAKVVNWREWQISVFQNGWCEAAV